MKCTRKRSIRVENAIFVHVQNFSQFEIGNKTGRGVTRGISEILEGTSVVHFEKCARYFLVVGWNSKCDKCAGASRLSVTESNSAEKKRWKGN